MKKRTGAHPSFLKKITSYRREVKLKHM